LHLAWSVMVLLGGVVIGIAPATVTLVTVLRGQNEFARATGSRALAAAVWARYRREVPGANCAAGPFVIIALAAGANVGLGLAGARWAGLGPRPPRSAWRQLRGRTLRDPRLGGWCDRGAWARRRPARLVLPRGFRRGDHRSRDRDLGYFPRDRATNPSSCCPG